MRLLVYTMFITKNCTSLNSRGYSYIPCLLRKIAPRFTCGRRKIWSNIKKSQKTLLFFQIWEKGVVIFLLMLNLYFKLVHEGVPKGPNVVLITAFGKSNSLIIWVIWFSLNPWSQKSLRIFMRLDFQKIISFDKIIVLRGRLSTRL